MLFCMWIITALIVIIVDRLSKIYISGTMAPGDTFPLLDGLLHITYVQNRGVAFGQFDGIAAVTTYMPILLVIGCIVAMIVLRRKTDALVKIAAGLVIGGGIGNIIDRIAIGYVVDFIDVKLWPPVFNVADMGICVGCGLFLIAMLRSGNDN